MKVRDGRYMLGLAPLGALVASLALYTVGIVVAFVTDVGWFLAPGTLFGLAYAGNWGGVQHQKLRILQDRYENHLQREQSRVVERQTRSAQPDTDDLRGGGTEEVPPPR